MMGSKKASAVDLLDRLLQCREREDAANHKGAQLRDTMTGDRYRATAGNWGEKADQAERELRELLTHNREDEYREILSGFALKVVKAWKLNSGPEMDAAIDEAIALIGPSR